MTGRYTLTAPLAQIAEHFDATVNAPELELLGPRYNIAPLQTLPIVRKGERRAEIVPAQWGLIPFWAKDPGIAAHMINARADNVTLKPAFKAALRRRRCLVPANGFFEWKMAGSPNPARKQPYWFAPKEGELIAFAGLWERWRSPAGEVIESYTIITTVANAAVRPVAERMPVIVPGAHYARWLGVIADPAFALSLIEPAPAGLLRAVAVSTAVNNTAHDAPDCIAPVEPPA